MPKEEIITMTTTMSLSENGEHRYLLKKVWDKTKKKATVIMLAPSSSDGVTLDNTTMYVINNLYRLDFGSISILNMFSKINAKLKNNKTFEGLTDKDNDKAMLQAAEESDTIIIAWGKSGDNNKKILKRQREIYKLLEPFKDKLVEIHSDHGDIGFHPLAPQIRFCWILETFKIPVIEEPEETSPKSAKSGRKGRKKVEPTQESASPPEQENEKEAQPQPSTA